jgi:hypothetical protein
MAQIAAVVRDHPRLLVLSDEVTTTIIIIIK